MDLDQYLITAPRDYNAMASELARLVDFPLLDNEGKAIDLDTFLKTQKELARKEK